MKTALTAAALGILATLVTAPAVAGPLRPERVGADAEWVVHVDVEALTRSAIGRFVLEHAGDLGIDMSEIEKVRGELGIDPRTDVFSVTAYGPTAAGEDDGVIVAVTNGNADEAMARVMAMPEIRAELLDVDGYPVHALTDEDETMYVHLRPDGDRRILVAGDDRESLLRALRVLDGRAGDAKKAAVITRPPGSGSIVFAAVRDADLLEEFEPASDIARLSEMVTIDVGESDGALFALAAITAGNEQDSRDVAQVVQGLIALGRLVAGQEPDLEPLRELASALQVTAEGSQIRVQFEYDTRPLIEAMKESFEAAEHEEERTPDP